MNCFEFEDRWNDLLDTRSESRPELERSLAAHASICEPCQALSARYQLLRQAIAVFEPSPTLSIASAERLRRSLTRPGSRKVAGRWLRVAVPLATAAALFALTWPGSPWRPSPLIVSPVEIRGIVPTPTTSPIETAWGEATSATIDLAREASAPAARIGRDVLTFEEPGDSTDEANLETEPGSNNPAAEMLQSVGDRVKPISGSARHAFSFLLGPPPGAGKVAPDSGQLTR